MDNADKLVATATAEIERILNSKTVVGQPIIVDGCTVIPLLSVGFGFALGTGSGSDAKQGHGGGAGVGGGGGVRPIALIIADKNGVRVEALKGGTASVLEKAAESLTKVLGKGGTEKAAE